MTSPAERAPAPEPPRVAPLDADGVGAVAVGTVLWLVALVVLLILRDRLVAAGAEWWLWVAVTGAALGVPGLIYTTRRRAAYRRAQEEVGSDE